jgi:secretion/DNA translocation related TadE-like protein
VRSEKGSVSIVLAALILVCLTLVLGAADVGAVLLAKSRAAAAADAAALAAAQELVLPTEGDPSAVASRFASANGSELTSCQCAPGSLEATVEVRTEVGSLHLVPGRRFVTERARAIVDLQGLAS